MTTPDGKVLNLFFITDHLDLLHTHIRREETCKHLSGSKFSGICLQFPKLYVACSDRITCRYGGGSSSRLEDSRRSQSQENDDDQALDLSTIRSNTVRLIDDQQNMVGIVSKSAAIQMAEDAELDLVILSPDADPPVVKLMDYNKYRYEQQKKKREQQKKSAALRMDQKELKMGYNIDVHDYSVRLRAAQKFLKDGDKVKVIVNLKGRQNEFRKNAIELLNRFRNDIGELGIEESKNLRDRNMFMVLIPNKVVVVQKEPPKKKRKSKSTETEVSATASI
ncbi:putative translation initiation factor 3 [Helianthus annuus]|nr:putative translation initiation factor 3 [Helianthus annuus]